MFTGIIETVGTVESVAPMDGGRRLRVAAPWAGDLAVGESVALDGCCLTVVAADGDAFEVEAVRETLSRTTLGAWEPGRRVHLERAIAAGDRLGGHLVQGHVDHVGTVQSIERQGENRYIEILLPASGRALTAERGSIAVNGVSLTVLAVTEGGARISIIPHTWEVTTFRDLSPGDPVNVEYDLVARYVRRLLEARE